MEVQDYVSGQVLRLLVEKICRECSMGRNCLKICQALLELAYLCTLYEQGRTDKIINKLKELIK